MIIVYKLKESLSWPLGCMITFCKGIVFINFFFYYTLPTSFYLVCFWARVGEHTQECSQWCSGDFVVPGILRPSMHSACWLYLPPPLRPPWVLLAQFEGCWVSFGVSVDIQVVFRNVYCLYSFLKNMFFSRYFHLFREINKTLYLIIVMSPPLNWFCSWELLT